MFLFNVPLLATGRQSLIVGQMFYAPLVVLCLGVPLIYYQESIGAAYTVLAGEAVIVFYVIKGYVVCINKKQESSDGV